MLSALARLSSAFAAVFTVSIVSPIRYSSPQNGISGISSNDVRICWGGNWMHQFRQACRLEVACTLNVTLHKGEVSLSR
jgi:hypothetical protein